MSLSPRASDHEDHILPGQPHTLKRQTELDGSPHSEILQEAATLSDDSEGLLSFICAEVPRIARSEGCPCLWCTHVEDNPLIVFDDLQKQMVNKDCRDSHKEGVSASVSAVYAERDDMSPTTMIALPPAPILYSLDPLTSIQVSGVIERHTNMQPLSVQMDHISGIDANSSESQGPSQQAPILNQPQPTPQSTVHHQRRKRTSRPIDQRAILAEEIRRREEERARGLRRPMKRKSNGKSR